MAAVWLAPLTRAPESDVVRITELLHRLIAPAEPVQHVSIRAGPEGLIVFGFLTADGDQQARDLLRRLIEQGMANHPELRMWRVV